MFEAQRHTRRIFLQRTGMLGGVVLGGAFLAACGGSDSGGGGGEAAGDDAAATASGTVRTLMWEGYEMPDAFSPLGSGIAVEAAFMAANEDVINKKGTYDIGCGIQGIYPALNAAGVLSAIDTERLPNLSKVIPGFETNPLIEFDGKQTGMPYVWASQGMTFLDDGQTAPTKLEDLLSPQFRGKVGIGDDGNSVIIQVARMLGLGGDRPAFLTEAELDQVFDALAEFKANAFGIIANPYGEYAGAYARGEITAAFPDWGPTAVAASEQGKQVSVIFPPTSFSWIDSLFIANGVEQTDTMYAFLNQAIDPETQYQVGNALQLAVVNADAEKRLVDQGGAWGYYGDPDALFAAAPNVEWPPVDGGGEYADYATWLKRWQDFKAS
jgi:spermidine/putrescine transport system substrate-binding protein